MEAIKMEAMKMDAITAEAKANLEAVRALRRQLHSWPELGRQEEKTAALVAKTLTELGFTVRTGVGGYGVIADLEGKEGGSCVAFRADMDALSITEQTGCAYASQNKGVMHACGHDVHVSGLLGAAMILAEHKDELCGNVRLIFQPAEESSPIGGSRAMIEGGAMEGVDAVFGLHVWPDLPHGVVGVRNGAMMAASDHFTIRLTGKSSHGAKPHNGIDAVLLGAEVLQKVQSVISRETDPMQPAVLTIGRMQAGTRYNIIAENCELEGTCRTYDPATRSYIGNRMKEIVDGICALEHAQGEIEYETGYNAVINTPKEAAFVRKCAAELFGDAYVNEPEMAAMTAEDFSFYLGEAPGAFIWLGTGTEDLHYPLHSSKFNVDEDILWRGPALIAHLMMSFLK